MNKEMLNRLLDGAYELEGLLHLALQREEMPERFEDMIMRKAREVNALASKLGNNRGAEPQEFAYGDGPGVYGAPEPPEPEVIHQSEAIPEPEAISEPEVNPVPGVIRGAAADTAPIAGDEPETPREGKAVEPKGRLVFSVNDRYRFRRALFGNSDTAFNDAMALVAQMESPEEAEDYFINELQWDEADQEVIDFMEVLRKYFS